MIREEKLEKLEKSIRAEETEAEVSSEGHGVGTRENSAEA